MLRPSSSIWSLSNFGLRRQVARRSAWLAPLIRFSSGTLLSRTSAKLININRAKLEALLHRFFAAARLDVEIPDRFGRAVKQHEWFLVLLHIIDEVVARIKDQSITLYVYSPQEAALKKL